MSALRYFHTLRHLRPVQVYGRVWHRFHRARPDLRPAPAERQATGKWQPGCTRDGSMLAADTFRFLNVTGHLRRAEDWDDPARLRLWRYNLHYFDDLNAEGAEGRGEWHRGLVARWVKENRPAAGTGWEPYPVSIRIVNWLKWAIANRNGDPARLDAAALDSLAAQARWLRARLEFHLLGNHLWANAKALVFAGVFFEGEEADRWRRDGLAILDRQVDEQILPDGGHFERSPMYHALLLEDLLDVINLAGTYPHAIAPGLVAKLADTARRMLRWLRVMTHPDGGISFFNDAAFGIAPGHAALDSYAGRVGLATDAAPVRAVEALPDSGYVRLQNDRAVVICDVAPVGPDYLPAHAHADTLSFELSLDGRRVIVNGGTSTYEAGPERSRQRGTAAHSTVVVDDQDSSEVWGSFRVARRARPQGVASGSEGSQAWLDASHDGYRRLPNRVSHRRRWTLDPDGLTVSDVLSGAYASAQGRLHLHPGVQPDGGNPLAIRLLAGVGGPTVEVSCSPVAPLLMVRSTWHPEFGLSVETTSLVAAFRGGSFVTRLAW